MARIDDGDGLQGSRRRTADRRERREGLSLPLGSTNKPRYPRFLLLWGKGTAISFQLCRHLHRVSARMQPTP